MDAAIEQELLSRNSSVWNIAEISENELKLTKYMECNNLKEMTLIKDGDDNGDNTKWLIKDIKSYNNAGLPNNSSVSTISSVNSNLNQMSSVNSNLNTDRSVNLSSLRVRINDTIRMYGGEVAVRNSPMIGEIPIGVSLNSIDLDVSREQYLSMMRGVVRDDAISDIRQGSHNIQYIGGLLEQLHEASRYNNIDNLNNLNNTNWSLDVNVDTLEVRRNTVIARLENSVSNSKDNADIYKSNGKKLLDMYDKYCQSGKPRLFWYIWEKYTDNYNNYKDFKQSWEPNTKLRKQVSNSVKAEVEKLLNRDNPFGNKSRIDHSR